MDIIELLCDLRFQIVCEEWDTVSERSRMLYEAANTIESLRIKFWQIIDLEPSLDDLTHMDKQDCAKIIAEMVKIANAALKRGE